MRLLVLSVSALWAACLGVTSARAQADQIPPYLTHIDRRHGNDHVYPDRGAVVRDLPRGAIAVHYAGIAYRFAGGVWYQPIGPAYIVVAPPIGLIVPRLPAFATAFESGGQKYLYADDVFYRPRGDLGGYEVVNDPQDLVPEHLASAAPASDATSAVGLIAVPPTLPPPSPPVPSSSAPALPNPTRVAIVPRNGQGADQEASDRYACYRFAVTQSGFDPLESNGAAASSADSAQREVDYSRAQAACLEKRGYTVQ